MDADATLPSSASQNTIGLHGIGILELVHQQVPVLLLQCSSHARVLAQHAGGEIEQVAVVQRVQPAALGGCGVSRASEEANMAAVTFTRKAASELRGRFHLALEARLESARDKAPEAEIRRLQAALSNLERFFAGTIHSFCARLLRERPVESGVSPGFTELDEVQDLELRKRVWREFITDAREERDPDVAALLEADIKLKDSPEGLRKCRMHGERAEVAPFEREIEKQAHHQRRAEVFLGRIDAALDEKRRAHAERNIERRHEPQIQPAGALECDPLAERSANGMRGYKTHFARVGYATKRRQLIDEGIRQ